MIDKKFSTEFEAHKGLIHKLTKKCWGRLKEVGIDDHEYEDVFQINCISYVKVAKAYNPERGITFGAYLGRAIYNEFNKYADKIINEKVALHLQSYEDFSSQDGDDIDFMASYREENSVVDMIEHSFITKEEARENIAKLSGIARLVIRELLAPSVALKQSFIGMQAHSEMAKSQGERYIRVPNTINIRAIRLHYGFKNRDMVNLRQEFIEHLGVRIE